MSLNLYTYCANNPLMYYDPDGHKYVRKEVAPGFYSDVYEAEYEYVRKEVVPGMYANVYEEKYVMPVESSPESNYTPLPETSINYAYNPYDISLNMEFNTISIFDIYESATGRKLSWDVGWNRITNWFSELPENLENAKDNPKDTALGIGNSVVNSGSQVINIFNSGFWAMNGNQQMADHSYRSFNSYTEKAQTYVIENHVKNPKAFEFGNQAGDIGQTIWGLKDLTKVFKSFGSVPFKPTKALVDAGTGIPFKPSWLDDAVKQKSNIHKVNGNAGTRGEGITVGQKKQSYVYRVIRNSENPSEGLTPKNKNARLPLEDHVIDKDLRTQYISTTTELSIAKKWALKDGKRVVKIDLNKLTEYGDEFSVFDLSTETGRNMYLKQPKAQGYAKASSEVVIKGNIPPEAVELVDIIR